MLTLFNNGLNSPEHKEWGSWGGRFKSIGGNQKRWVDDHDRFGNYTSDPDIGMSAVYRWRAAWQADFESRLDWCIKPFREANHAPVFDMVTKQVNVRPREKVTLELKKISDPDGDALRYRWFFYPEEGTYKGSFPEINSNTKRLSFTAPEISQSETMHVILEVSDTGKPSLVRYKRFIVGLKR
jgi:hypothetical protein